LSSFAFFSARSGSPAWYAAIVLVAAWTGASRPSSRSTKNSSQHQVATAAISSFDLRTDQARGLRELRRHRGCSCA
jgi:hypothetical protein